MASLEQHAGLLVNFFTVMTISRFLGPSETGLAIVGLGIAAIVFSLREFASPEFLIKLDKVRDEDIQTSITFLMSLTALLAAALYMSRKYFAAFYNDESLILFLDVTIVAALIESVSFPVVAMLRREMAFGMLARIRTTGSCFGAAITVAMAYCGFGHMCMAFGLLASALVTTALALTLYPIGRLLRPNISAIQNAWRFGMYLGGNAALNKICETFPQLMLGRFMPMASVGVYNRANTVSGLPDRVILSAVFTVAFPVLSAQVREGTDLRESYIGALSYITVVYWPAQAVLAILAYPAVHIILGPGWSDAIPIVAISSLASIFWFPVILTYPLLMALGHNCDAFLSNLLSRTVAALILCAASFHGLLAVALSQFISSPFQMIVAILFVHKYVPYSYAALIQALLRSGLVTVLTLIVPLAIVAANDFSFEISWITGGAIAIAAAVSWIIAVLSSRHPFARELIHIFNGVLRWLPVNWSAIRQSRSALTPPTPAD